MRRSEARGILEDARAKGFARKALVRPPGTDGPYARAVERARAALARQGMDPTPVQVAVFGALGDRRDALVVAPTGSGKTAAVLLPVLASLAEAMDASRDEPHWGVRVVYVAPVRALVAGHAVRITELAADLGVRVRVGARTGDTPSRERTRMARNPPDVLAVTPESLAVMLGSEARGMLAGVTEVVLDEIHALASGKRGALLSATLEVLTDTIRLAGGARPRRLALTATAHPMEDLAAWVGMGTRVIAAGGGSPAVMELSDPVMDGAYPTGGWAWRTALPAVARRIAGARATALVFVGARARAEQWTLALRDVLPARMAVACFHGSLSAEERAGVATALASGEVRAVVSTSGLETGVDLPAVSDVVMLSAPASVTRLVQAAGRAEHRPGAVSRAVLVPTSAHDLVRCAAVLRAAARGEREPVELREGDLDVAVQAAIGRLALGPCTRDELAETLRRAWTFRDLSDGDLDAVLNFLATGGDALAAYPELARAVTADGRWAMAGARSLRKYLRGIGTIVGDVTVTVRHGAATVGQVEGRFASLLGPGERFVLAGRTWRVVSLAGDVLQVRPDRSDRRAVPHWAGSRAAMSATVAAEVERLWTLLDTAVAGRTTDEAAVRVGAILGAGDANARAVAGLVRAQRAVAVVPGEKHLALEIVRDGRRMHVVAFTFAGQMANEVVARTVAVRVRRATGLGAEVCAMDDAMCVTLTGLGQTPDEATLRSWLSPHGLRDDLGESIGGGVLAGAYFREVARIAQLWSPDARRGSVTPGLLYDVLRKHDPGHVLLRALGHTLWTALEGPRAEEALARCASRPWARTVLDGPSPMAIPVFAWTSRDAVAPDDPEAALAAAAHALYLRATAGGTYA